MISSNINNVVFPVSKEKEVSRNDTMRKFQIRLERRIDPFPLVINFNFHLNIFLIN